MIIIMIMIVIEIRRQIIRRIVIMIYTQKPRPLNATKKRKRSSWEMFSTKICTNWMAMVTTNYLNFANLLP
jgi:hypothetical protein